MAGASFTPLTDKSPSVEVLDDVLYMVWKTAGKSAIRSAKWDGTSWSGGDVITIASPGQNPETNNSPYLARYGEQLVMVHKYKDSDDIHWELFSAGVWSGGTRMAVIDNKDSKHPGTNKRPALIQYDGKLYMLFKGSHSNTLRQCTYDGTDWRGNNEIKDSAAKFTPESNEGPGLAGFAGAIYMFYKGANSDNIWMSMYNGIKWNGNVALKDVTSIAPTSNRSPWVVRVVDELFLLNAGSKSKLHYSVLKPVTF
jgi:hypothetical protein